MGGLRLGVSTDTLGDEGCAVTSGAMVAAFYGVKTDPNLLDDFLTRTGGLDKEGYIDWNAVPAIAPSRFKLIYNGSASYRLIDSNLLAGNPVIVVIPLLDGAYHFVVIVGKEGRDYLIRDPAAAGRPYPLRRLTDKIGDICIFAQSIPLPDRLANKLRFRSSTPHERESTARHLHYLQWDIAESDRKILATSPHHGSESKLRNKLGR